VTAAPQADPPNPGAQSRQSAAGPPTRSATAAGDDTGDRPVVADLESLRSLWPAVVDLVRAQNALLGALIEEAEPVALEGEELTVAFAASAPFLKKKAEDPLNRAAVTEALVSLTGGGRWRLSYELRGASQSPDASPLQVRSEEEWVARLVEEFDAEELPRDAPAAPDAAEQQPRRAQSATAKPRGG
jgi:hypothetical protein